MTEIRWPRSSTSNPLGLRASPRPYPVLAMLLSRTIEPKCCSGAFRAEGLEHVPEIVRSTVSPEADAEPGARAQDPESFTERSFATTPDPVDRNGCIEGRVVPGKLEHRSESGGRHAECGSGRRSTRSGAASIPATEEPIAVANRTASPDPQAMSISDRPGPDADPGEHGDDDVERIVLVEARPVVGCVTPGLAGVLPIVSRRVRRRMLVGFCRSVVVVMASSSRLPSLRVMKMRWRSDGGLKFRCSPPDLQDSFGRCVRS